MGPLVLGMKGSETMAGAIARHLGCETGAPETRAFPDGETYLRIASAVRGRAVAIVESLDRPDAKFLPLIFAADAARDLGAAQVGLVAPYLAYMRQDRRFRPGEAVTSRSVAQLISSRFDWLVCVDPHLHRYRSLAEIYSIPARALHAAPLMGRWIAANVADPVLVGPDSESEQWVGDVAARAGAPYTVLEKIRSGDREVEIRLRDGAAISGRIPVLVDDIVSSGRTMLAAVRLLKSLASPQPVCLAVHGLFADRSDELLRAEGVRLVTANTVAHASNALDVSAMLADAVSGMRSVRPGASS
ncbi:MAG TPA: ribose-phosphate pyrophosphokinase [Rhizomicrobium sp.]|nr:ribose-phosphate pyrophosphokinase [Rhizomicrobium sp.]